MPKIRPGMKKPPPGFDLISDKLDQYDEQMHLAIQEESTGVVGQTRKKRGRDKTSKKKKFVSSTCKQVKYEQQRQQQHQDDNDDNNINNDDHDEKGDDVKQSNTHKDNEDHTQQTIKQHYQQQVLQQQQQQQRQQQQQQQQKPIPPMWKIAQINAARTRYVFDSYYRQHCISQEVFDYCCEMQFIDGGLARRWKLPGYEKLCCNACALPGAASLAASRNAKYAHRHSAQRKHYYSSDNKQSSTSSAAATCICRVPASQRRNKSFLRCSVCGCTGCCSSDTAKTEQKQVQQQQQHEQTNNQTSNTTIKFNS